MNIFFLFFVGVVLIGSALLYDVFSSGIVHYKDTAELLRSMDCTNATIIMDNATMFVASCINQSGNGSTFYIVRLDKISTMW